MTFKAPFEIFKRAAATMTLFNSARDIPWSGDGSHLFIRENAGGLTVRISRLDLSTGRRESWKELKPADTAGVTGEGVLSILLTPDGRSYAYSYVRLLSDLYLVDGLKK